MGGVAQRSIEPIGRSITLSFDIDAACLLAVLGGGYDWDLNWSAATDPKRAPGSRAGALRHAANFAFLAAFLPVRNK